MVNPIIFYLNALLVHRLAILNGTPKAVDQILRFPSPDIQFCGEHDHFFWV